MSVSCSLRTSCGGAGCISSMNPPAVSFPRERDRPGSWGSCFQMVHAYTQGQCIWAMQGCMWWVLSTALSLPLRRPLFLPAACVSVGDGFSSALPRLALSCLFQDCVPPYIGGDGPVCLQWLAGLRVQTSALWSPCRAILKSSTRQESPAGSPGTAAETSLWFILSHCPVLPPSGSCSWGLSHGTYISESFSWAPNLRQEVTAILPHFGPVENVPYWSCRIPQGHRAGEGQRENCTAVDSKSIASRCFLLTRFSPPPAAALPSFVLDSDANAPVVGVVGRRWLDAGAGNELSTTRPHHTQRWVSSLTGSLTGVPALPWRFTLQDAHSFLSPSGDQITGTDKDWGQGD